MFIIKIWLFKKGHFIKDSFGSQIRTVFVNREIKIKKFTSILPFFQTSTLMKVPSFMKNILLRMGGNGSLIGPGQR